MHIEVDQSGRIEDSGDTILALSNSVDFAISISSAVKNAAVGELKRRGISSIQIKLKLFSAGLFLLLKNYLDDASLITIDNEYDGHGKNIIRLLLEFIWKADSGFSEDKIEVSEIGKKSLAHKKAWETKRGFIKPNKKIKARELLGVLSK